MVSDPLIYGHKDETLGGSRAVEAHAFDPSTRKEGGSYPLSRLLLSPLGIISTTRGLKCLLFCFLYERP